MVLHAHQTSEVRKVLELSAIERHTPRRLKLVPAHRGCHRSIVAQLEAAGAGLLSFTMHSVIWLHTPGSGCQAHPKLISAARIWKRHTTCMQVQSFRIQFVMTAQAPCSHNKLRGGSQIASQQHSSGGQSQPENVCSDNDRWERRKMEMARERTEGDACWSAVSR